MMPIPSRLHQKGSCSLRLVIVLLSILVSNPGPYSGTVSARTDEVSFQQYLVLVEGHRQGEFVETAKTLGAAPKGSIRSCSKRLAEESIAGIDRRAAVLLHTQVAILIENRGDPELWGTHLDAARRICDRITDSDFKSRWYLALGYYYQTNLKDLSAIEIFKMLLKESPGDAQILLAMGTVYEAGGSMFDRPRSKLSSLPSSGSMRVALQQKLRAKRARDRKLRQAADVYRQALASSPDFAEARLRLGKVSQLLGEEEYGCSQFEWVIGESSDRYLVSLAHLFCGRLLEERNELPEAHHHYRSAVEAGPEWQVMHLALSHALRRSGDIKASAEVLMRGLQLSVNPRNPFGGLWKYYIKFDEFVEIVAELRRLVARGTP